MDTIYSFVKVLYIGQPNYADMLVLARVRFVLAPTLLVLPLPAPTSPKIVKFGGIYQRMTSMNWKARPYTNRFLLNTSFLLRMKFCRLLYQAPFPYTCALTARKLTFKLQTSSNKKEINNVAHKTDSGTCLLYAGTCDSQHDSTSS